MKACDLHLPTEIVKTFREPFRMHEIEVIHFDGDCSNCHLDNLVGKIKANKTMVSSPMNVVPPSHKWTQNKMWNGQLMPNYFCSLDGDIALINDSTILPRKIGSWQNCYLVNMHGMRFDARKIIWRAFTTEEPIYSQEHYKIHTISKTKQNPLAFDNLVLIVASSIFDQWMKENEVWCWKRSKKGNVPKEEKKKQKKEKKTRSKRSKTSRNNSVLVPPNTRIKVSAPQPPKKETAPAKKPAHGKRSVPLQKMKIKLMSEKKFEALRFKVQRLNITTSKKERQIFEEQRVLRRLKRFEKKFA